MKRFIIILSLVISSSVFAGYDYIITDGMNFGALILNDNQSLLMTGGGGYGLDLYDWSYARIENTSPLVRYQGGIWELAVAAYAHLDLSGGEIYEINIGDNATAILSGGKINRLKTNQPVWKWDYSFDPPKLVPDPHVEIICRDYNYNTVTRMLTGTWNVDNNKDGLFDTFNIQLVDVQGAPPTIENIKFIPEPATALLLAAGGLYSITNGLRSGWKYHLRRK